VTARSPADGRALAGVAVLLLVPACTATPVPAPHATPPPPPAACLLDVTGLLKDTGVMWTPDAATASDARCVYDAGPGPNGPVFLAVTLAPPSQADPAAEIESVAQLCDRGSRVALDVDRGGLLCRFGGGQVLGAVARDDTTVLVTTSDTPTATTGAKLVVAVESQLKLLG
jgi:hypothetical protein